MYHSPLFNQIKSYLEECSEDETIFLFVPYVKTEILKELVNQNNKIILVTTWEPKDILSGSSELELYPFCKSKKITLYVNENLHLKVYSIGLSNAILATGNISKRGLCGGNYEAAVKIEQLSNHDRMFFAKIRNEARLVDDQMYNELNMWIQDNKMDIPDTPQLFDIISDPKTDDFSVASLPMTKSVDELVDGYVKISQGMNPSNNEETSACIFHDLANYSITSGLTKDEFLIELSDKFFSHPFIQKIDAFIAPEAYFGRIKEWIQNNCTDVPIPSRRELTGNVQVLLEWFERLGNGRYIIDVPGARSQRIRKVM